MKGCVQEQERTLLAMCGAAALGAEAEVYTGACVPEQGRGAHLPPADLTRCSRPGLPAWEPLGHAHLPGACSALGKGGELREKES